jgi:hypothetical protein
VILAVRSGKGHVTWLPTGLVVETGSVPPGGPRHQRLEIFGHLGDLALPGAARWFGTGFGAAR